MAIVDDRRRRHGDEEFDSEELNLVNKKRGRSSSVEDEESERGRKRRLASEQFFELEAEVDSDEEEEEEDEEDDFIVPESDLADEDGNSRRQVPQRSRMFIDDDDDDLEEIKRIVKERYAKSSEVEYDDDDHDMDVAQQAFLPSVKDSKLWMVKCAIGHERETTVFLMQKYIDRPDLQIKSVITLDSLKGYIYVEADKEAHVKEACKGLRNINSSAKVMIVPIKEMTEVLCVESKSVDLARGTWVRMKIGIYKGDLAKVVDVENVKQRVTVKLIPRVDLQTLANKLNGKNMQKMKTFIPPPRFFNIDEARKMHIRVKEKRDRNSGECFQMVNDLLFKDGFLYKTVSVKSISSGNIKPTFNDLEKFQEHGEDTDGDIASLSGLVQDKKHHFVKGDAVIVSQGELKNLKGWVEKVDAKFVHIRPKLSGLPKTLAFDAEEICKYFKPGDHIKVVSGVHEGVTGMVIKVEDHVLIILSDTTKDHIRVFAKHVVGSSEITNGVTKVGDYELHDLVLLEDMSFGVIIRMESEALQVLKGEPGQPQVLWVKLREIRYKIERKASAKDRFNNLISLKDSVRVIDGVHKGTQGSVEHVYRGLVFIYDRNHQEDGGFVCAKAQSCTVVGGLQSSDRNVSDSQKSRLDYLKSRTKLLPPPKVLPSERPSLHSTTSYRAIRGGFDPLIGKYVKIRSGPFKGYWGHVNEVKGSSIRIELESQMKMLTVDRNNIVDASTSFTIPDSDWRYESGSKTPMHPPRTPFHPSQTPMRDLEG